MRRLIGVMTIALGLGLGMSGVSHAQLVSGGIAGSSHDFTDNLKGKRDAQTGAGTAMDESWNHRGEICRVCHVPHDHGRNQALWTQGLLWNHALSSATYTMYDAGFSNANGGNLTGAQDAQPTGSSKLCLGCHDGTVAVDSFDNKAPGLTGVNFIGTPGGYDGGYKVPGFLDGTAQDMRGTHPISIAFTPAKIGTEYHDPAGANWAAGNSVASTLEDGKVQCATCHDVHAQETIVGTHLLREGQTVAQNGQASGLCLTCHIK